MTRRHRRLTISSVATIKKRFTTLYREFRLTTDAGNVPGCSIWTANAWTTAAVSSNPLTSGAWQNVLCTYDGVNIKIYVDGEQKGSSAQTELMRSFNYTPLTVGHDFNGSNYFKGLIDDIRVYNYALTLPQIKTVINEISAIRFGPASGSP